MSIGISTMTISTAVMVMAALFPGQGLVAATPYQPAELPFGAALVATPTVVSDPQGTESANVPDGALARIKPEHPN